MNNSPVTTTIIDDTPKYKAIVALAIFFGLFTALVIAAAVVLGSLHLDERARLALDAARQVGDSTRYYKVLFIIVFWLDLAAVTTTAAVSVSAMIGARAVAVVRAALLPPGPKVFTAPPRREELKG